MTSSSSQALKRHARRRPRRKVAQPRPRCLPDPEFRARTHRRPFVDDGSRTPPAGDPLFPKR